MRIDFRGHSIEVGAGEFIIVPRGVEHRPSCEEECLVMLFEPKTTLNTGNVENQLTQRELEHI